MGPLLAWFFPEVARPGSLVPTAYSPIVTPLDFAVPSGQGAMTSVGRRLAVVSACRNTADMLAKQAAQAGWTADAYTAVPQSWSSTHAAPELVVWDDSLLPCLPRFRCCSCRATDQPTKELQSQHTNYWVDWLRESVSLALAASHGCVDLCVKPSAALGLSNYLFYQTVQRQVA